MASKNTTNKKGNKGTSQLPHVTNPAVICAICEENAEESLQCKVCKVSFHPSCVDISDDVFNCLQPILPIVGWVCEECVSLLTEKRNLLKKDIDGLLATVSRLEIGYAALTKQVEMQSEKPATSVKSIEHTANSTGSRPVSDDKRRFNVVISGLGETIGRADEKLAIKDLLHKAHDMQPSIASCRRIEKVTTDRPRKLLVTFVHASACDDVLALARERKLSSLPECRGVFINPDLTPDEAKAAYEARQAKKNRHANNSTPLQVNLPPLSNTNSAPVN
jgi:hypothetical protein